MIPSRFGIFGKPLSPEIYPRAWALNLQCCLIGEAWPDWSPYSCWAVAVTILNLRFPKNSSMGSRHFRKELMSLGNWVK